MDVRLREAASILCEGTEDTMKDAYLILEDESSPVTRNYREQLFESIVSRSHVDFGDIPKSTGDITKYSGITAMIETLEVLLKVANEEKSASLLNATSIVMDAITNMKSLRTVFVSGFAKKNNIAILDYNTYTLTCVEAVNSLLCNYVDFIKTPSSPVFVLDLKNTKYRANELYIDQLKRFNAVCKNGSYAKYLTSIINNGQQNFTGTMIIGAAFVGAIALSIIPVTRELIYFYNERKRKLSDMFALQAYFLELNKANLEMNTSIKPEKKKKILERQEKVRKLFIHMSEKMRIENANVEDRGRKKLESDNRDMTIDGTKDDISDSDIVIV